MSKNILFFKNSINSINLKKLYKKNTINNLGYVRLIKEENIKNNNNIDECNICNNDKYDITFNLSNNTQKTYKAIYYKKFGQLFFYHP